MLILGIDPGIGRMGWGIITIENSKLKIVNSGCIETSSKLPVPERLLKIHKTLKELIEEHKPDALAVEELFFNTNAKTAFVVGQARGVVLLLGAQFNLKIGIYTPLQVKMALTGYGRAEKTQMGKMVKTLLNLKEVPKPDDTADALAVALTHAFSYKKHFK
ncbi:MAG: crossover junction endodeoxyribonuclease RuvC [Candidatus Levybacteria bacterium RIFCSPHIGHO2_12_FULL_38_12]|nr:MAG: crossover junction endodeoxyribonuclease RuvC [Candidatus Levybacteria bacterium RIFCSPHIGHO2_01_FULL_38_12]OGH22298.1 MAG: crossover junction endodeoxyribonuclease RuvC [Candidatus Levybacteria bacterium RIFCSPHIGHO2_02_FULL_37_18]OGH22500.1 MAG: crossover junction endodeoxyribonuclease RuvC [Candidatus Levybacteria bacterium RIFCSPHIGHO2_12_FULL_38_12]OGH33755.1 MAG: crossover junction endodeoxyribonuclease RuvC [Candidatus Levybacteria bacterium RIFCSPLOWO2_01_FULL_37_20]OGH43455.1 M